MESNYRYTRTEAIWTLESSSSANELSTVGTNYQHMLLKPRLSTVSNVDWTNVRVGAFKATASTARHYQSQSQVIIFIIVISLPLWLLCSQQLPLASYITHYDATHRLHTKQYSIWYDSHIRVRWRVNHRVFHISQKKLLNLALGYRPHKKTNEKCWHDKIKKMPKIQLDSLHWEKANKPPVFEIKK